VDEADALRERMVEDLVRYGVVDDPAIERALRAVPRHVFVPEVSPAAAHALDDAVVTKRSPDGAPLISASAPGMVAYMLKHLRITQPLANMLLLLAALAVWIGLTVGVQALLVRSRRFQA